MGDLIGLIIVFSLYLIASSGRTKKGRKRTQSRSQNRSPMRQSAQGEQSDHRSMERDHQTHMGFDDAFVDGRGDNHTLQKSCESKRIHLHDVKQHQLTSADEGEDPCHAGSAIEADHLDFNILRDAEHEPFVQDVLRGVIMSEILTRPQDRAACRRGRR